MKKKTVSEKKKNEEELEEEIKNAEKEITLEELTESMPENNIRELLITKEIKAPVLERIANQEEIPSFNQFETPQRETEERRIDYSVSNEPKYSAGITEQEQERKYETNFIPPVLNQREIIGREEFFKPMRSAWETTEQMAETPGHFERFETERKRLPFEEEQKKYKKVKF
jgi:hypothetical protein